MTTPVARRILLALSSLRSASSSTVSSSLSMPSPVRAETGHHFDLAAPLDRLETLFGELLLDPVGLRVFLVHLVDGDDDRHFRGFDMRDRFARLRHDAVVGGDHEDRDVGDLGAAGAHRGERFVTGRVDERDLAIVFLDRVRADFCVMPPASPAATLAMRILSSSDVLPWST